MANTNTNVYELRELASEAALFFEKLMRVGLHRTGHKMHEVDVKSVTKLQTKSKQNKTTNKPLARFV